MVIIVFKEGKIKITIEMAIAKNVENNLSSNNYVKIKY